MNRLLLAKGHKLEAVVTLERKIALQVEEKKNKPKKK